MSDALQVALVGGLFTAFTAVVVVWLKRNYDLADQRRDDTERRQLCEEVYLRLLSHYRHDQQRLCIALANRTTNPVLFELILAELAAEPEWPNELRAPTRREEDRE